MDLNPLSPLSPNFISQNSDLFSFEMDHLEKLEDPMEENTQPEVTPLRVSSPLFSNSFDTSPIREKNSKILEQLRNNYINDALNLKVIQHTDGNSPVMSKVLQCQSAKAMGNYEALKTFCQSQRFSPLEEMVNDIFLNPFTRLTSINNTILGTIKALKTDHCFVSVRSHFLFKNLFKGEIFQFENVALTILLQLILKSDHFNTELSPIITSLYLKIQQSYGDELPCTIEISNCEEKNTYHRFNLANLYMLTGYIPPNSSVLSEAVLEGFFTKKRLEFGYATQTDSLNFTFSSMFEKYYFQYGRGVKSDLNLFMIENILSQVLHIFDTKLEIRVALLLEVIRLYNKFEIISTLHTSSSEFQNNIQKVINLINHHMPQKTQEYKNFLEATSKGISHSPCCDHDVLFPNYTLIPYIESRYDIHTYLPNMDPETQKIINITLCYMRKLFVTSISVFHKSISDKALISSSNIKQLQSITRLPFYQNLKAEEKTIVFSLFRLFNITEFFSQNVLKEYFGFEIEGKININNTRRFPILIFIFILENLNHIPLCKIFLDEVKRVRGDISLLLDTELYIYTDAGIPLYRNGIKPTLRSMLKEMNLMELEPHFTLFTPHPITNTSLAQTSPKAVSIEELQVFKIGYSSNAIVSININKDHYRLLPIKAFEMPTLPPVTSINTPSDPTNVPPTTTLAAPNPPVLGSDLSHADKIIHTKAMIKMFLINYHL